MSCLLNEEYILSASTEHRESPPVKRRKVARDSNQSGSDSEELLEHIGRHDAKGKSTLGGKVKHNGKRSATKAKSTLLMNGNFNGDADSEEGNSLMGFTERRATPKTNYDETSAHCPLPGCDSKGLCLCMFFAFFFIF